MAKRKTYRVRAKYLDEQGNGVVLFNHSLIPVPGLLPLELAEIQLYRRGEKTYGRIIELLETSGLRTDPECENFGMCGGCQLCHMRYEDQLEFKRQQVEKLFADLWPDAKDTKKRTDSERSLPGKTVSGKPVPDQTLCVPAVLGMEDPEGYRHKVHAAFTWSAGSAGKSKDNRAGNYGTTHSGFQKMSRRLDSGRRAGITAGIYQEGTHRVLPAKNCRIQDPKANEIIRSICRWMEELQIPPYDEDRHTGMVRHVLIRIGAQTDQIMVVLVTASLDVPKGKILCDRLKAKFPDIRTIVYNQNTQKTSMVLGEKQKVVYGEGYIEDRLCGLTFRISPGSFFQVNPSQAEVLYTKALELAQIRRSDRVLDAYCGTGTIALLAAGYAKEVVGVEANSVAVADAIENAKCNQIENVSFVKADAADYMIRMVRQCGISEGMGASAGEEKSIGGRVATGEEKSIGTGASAGEEKSIGKRTAVDEGKSIGKCAVTGNVKNMGKGTAVDEEKSIGTGAAAGEEKSIGGRVAAGEEKSIGTGAAAGEEKSIRERAAVGEEKHTGTREALRGQAFDVVIVDPPRSGCSRRFLDALIRMSPERFVYISCNPVTQRRDIQILVEKGYEIREILPVDMFPMTTGIETVVLMSIKCASSEPKPELASGLGERRDTAQSLTDFVRRKPDTHINVSLDMDDYHRIIGDEE